MRPPTTGAKFGGFNAGGGVYGDNGVADVNTGYFLARVFDSAAPGYQEHSLVEMDHIDNSGSSLR